VADKNSRDDFHPAAVERPDAAPPAAARLLGAWKTPVEIRRRSVADERARVLPPRSGGPAQGAQEFDTVLKRVDASLAEARAYSRPAGVRRDAKTLLLGGDIEAAWSAVHRAEELLLLVQDDATVRAKLPRLASEVQARVSPAEPRWSEFAVQLAAMRAHPFDPVRRRERLDRPQLREIRQTLNTISDEDHRRVRTFRNVVLVAILVLLAGLLIAASDPPGRPWLPVCTKPGRCVAIWHIEFVGALGGTLAGLAALRNLQGQAVTYALPYWMALLKVPAGALTGLLGTLWLQNNVFGLLTSQPGNRVLAYAALFGVAQEALTSFADRQARTLLGNARAAP
jgi:hypothetical protein